MHAACPSFLAVSQRRPCERRVYKKGGGGGYRSLQSKFSAKLNCTVLNVEGERSPEGGESIRLRYAEKEDLVLGKIHG